MHSRANESTVRHALNRLPGEPALRLCPNDVDQSRTLLVRPFNGGGTRGWRKGHPSIAATGSRDTDDLMRLDTQAPLRMRKAILDGGLRVAPAIRPVHRLQKEVLNIEIRETFRHRARLRED